MKKQFRSTRGISQNPFLKRDYNAGFNNTTGVDNQFEGSYARYSNTTGNGNYCTGASTGASAGASNTSGYVNCFAGPESGLYNTSGYENCFFGYDCGLNNTTGFNNTAIGYYAGYTNKTGGNNTFVGSIANASTTNLSNVTAIGAGAVVSQSNSMLFGNTSVKAWGFGQNPSTGLAFVVGKDSTNGNGAYLTIGGTWTNASDRNKKENFSTLNGNDVLNRIMQLPITRWNYKGEPAANTHIGPVAQDFYRLFKTGCDSLAISTIDPAGVALVGVQELHKKLETVEQENKILKKKLSVQDKKYDALEKEVQELKILMNIKQSQEVNSASLSRE